MTRCSTITLKLPVDFYLPAAVGHYGYCHLAPNHWDAHACELHRPLHVEDDHLVRARITQAGCVRGVGPRSRRLGDRLRIAITPAITRAQRSGIVRQVGRMLRLDECFDGWYALHRDAAAIRFARLLRSPSLFEDIIKTITGCNVAWANTISMNQRLCDTYGAGGFPTPAQLAAVEPDELKATCRVGYRAGRMLALARQVHAGELDLTVFEDTSRDTEGVYQALRKIDGLGPYAASNVLMHLGRYDRLAIDSETYRHFRECYGVPTPRDAGALRRLQGRIEAHYARYQPYAFLAYWYELWTGKRCPEPGQRTITRR